MNSHPSLKGKVTLVFATIGRDESVRRFVTSVRSAHPDLPIIAADQNGPTDEMVQFYKIQDVRMLWLPYDCGLSYARNRAFEQVNTEYVLLADDDFIFSEKTDIDSAIRILDNDKDLGFLGGSITDIRKDKQGNEKRLLRRWEKFFLLCDRTRTLVTIPIDYLPLQTRVVAGHGIYLCDMTSNWGLFRTEVFNQDIHWDENIKINGEHEDFFLNLKIKTNWQVAYFPGLHCDHHQPNIPDYHKLRSRLQGRQILANNWNLSHHLEIGVGLRDYHDYLAYLETPVHHPELFDGKGRDEIETMPVPASRRQGEYSEPGADPSKAPVNGADAQVEMNAMKDRITELEEVVSRQAENLQESDIAVREFQNSLSWRMTAPLRKLAALYDNPRRFQK